MHVTIAFPMLGSYTAHTDHILQSDDFLCAGRSGLKAQQARMYSEYTPSTRAKLSSRPVEAFVP